MYISNIIAAGLALASTAFAIDIRLSVGRQCDGGWVQCGAINPKTCCGTPASNHGSVGFRFIPPEWHLELRGYQGGRCSRRINTAKVDGVYNWCMYRNAFSGGGYDFRPVKRDLEEQSKECQLPDTLGLEDGSEYSLKELKESEVLEILNDLGNLTTAADIPGGAERLVRLK